MRLVLQTSWGQLTLGSTRRWAVACKAFILFSFDTWRSWKLSISLSSPESERERSQAPASSSSANSGAGISSDLGFSKGRFFSFEVRHNQSNRSRTTTECTDETYRSLQPTRPAVDSVPKCRHKFTSNTCWTLFWKNHLEPSRVPSTFLSSDSQV